MRRKLMPGRLRNEGIALYEAGEVILKGREGDWLRFSIQGEDFYYNQVDGQDSCTCSFSMRQNYCVHLAAVEAFLMQEKITADSAIKDLATGKEATPNPQRTYEQRKGYRFLKELGTKPEDGKVRFSLSAEGELLTKYRTSHLCWTLKIQRLPDKRTYVIRDITAFLNQIRREGEYQFGKNYIELLTLDAFDEPSQTLITYLWQLQSGSSKAFFYYSFRYLHLPSGFLAEGLALLQQLSSFSLTMDKRDYKSVSVVDLSPDDQFYHFTIKPDVEDIEFIVEERVSHVLFDGAVIFHLGNFYCLTPKQQLLAQQISDLPLASDLNRHLRVSWEDQQLLAEHLLDFALLGSIDAPESFQIRSFTPILSFDLLENGRADLQMSLDFGDVLVTDRKGLDDLPFVANGRLLSKLEHLLSDIGFRAEFRTQRPPLVADEIYRFFMDILPRLEKMAQVKLSPAFQNQQGAIKPAVYLEETGGLLDVSFDLSDLAPEDINRAMVSLEAAKPYFVSHTGQVMLLDDQFIKVSKTLQDLRAKAVGQGRFQLSRLANFQLRTQLAGVADVTFSKELEQMAKDLSHPEQFDLPALPIRADLRDYQTKGVKWLSVLNHYGFGGILADDMGLGKTLQAIAFLSQPLAQGKKVLILAPASLIYNWQEEFDKFLPGKQLAVVYGNKSERLKVLNKDWQVVITSYPSFRQDVKDYQKMGFDYLILDEAQFLKNSQTKIAQALRQFEAERIFALSGTPIENRLADIWSIFQFVLPGLLGTQKEFGKKTPQEVAKLIAPFVLRRRKEEVLTELPELSEVTYQNEMTTPQKAVYLAQLEQVRTQVSRLSPQGFSREKMGILAGLTRLRQICDSPSLFMDYEADSGKLASLKELLLQLKENGQRVLIFSQFRGMLDLIEKLLGDLELTHFMITGDTPSQERQTITRVFNKGSRDAVLISLKAGGVGLNLTGADAVILVDLWWNPAVDDQAVSRAHRMGQTKRVSVYRLITHGTIEEKILQMQEKKKNLIQDVLEDGQDRSSLNLEDIKEILGLEG